MSNVNRFGLAIMLLSVWLVAALKTLQNFVGVGVFVALAIGFFMLIAPDGGQ